MNGYSINIITRKTLTFLFIGTAITLFVFCIPARTMLLSNKINEAINVLYFVFGGSLLLACLVKQRLEILNTLLTAALTAAIVIGLVGRGGLGQYVVFIITMTMPFLMIGIRIPEDDFEHIFQCFIKFYNIFACIFLLIGIIDYISNASIQLYLASHHYYNSVFSMMVNGEHSFHIYRYYSFFGHPLDNAWYVLLFYVLNILNSRYYQAHINDILVTVLSVIGLLICGSRAALVIGLVLFLILNNRRNKPLYVIAFTAFCGVLFTTSIFKDNLLKRFNYSISAGNFSWGRNEIIVRLLKGFADPPSILTGGGLGYSRYFAKMEISKITNFEYPFMMFAYDFGILWTILIYVIIMAYPAIIFLKNRTYSILIGFLFLMAYLNTNNGISNYNDSMGQMCFVIMMLINLSYAVKRKHQRGMKIEEADNV
ncbi:MAG: hypothetical protein HPY50_06635 [Firmicutes bacterium]|nr:hypothetical protein [Bacillota bacterium]